MTSHEHSTHGARHGAAERSSSAPMEQRATASRGWTQRGWLEKKEGVTATWSRHWFQVEGDELHFYDAERSHGGSRLGVIGLADCTSMDHSTAATADVGEIEIKASTRTHRIQCGTDIEAEEWIEALNAAKDGRVMERPARSASRPARSASLSRTGSSGGGRRPGGKAPKHPWTQEEDEKLVALIIQHGANHWARIAQQIPGRVGKQCRERWQNHLNPDVNRAAEWSEEEEQALFKWHEILGNKWADIAKHLPGRTDNSVKNYFHKRVGQLKRGAPASRPKKSIEKSFKGPAAPSRSLVVELTRQSSSGSLDLEPADNGPPGASPRRSRSSTMSAIEQEAASTLNAAERAMTGLRARRATLSGGAPMEGDTLPVTPEEEETAENIDYSISPATVQRTGSGSARSRSRQDDKSTVLMERNIEMNSKTGISQPQAASNNSSLCQLGSFSSPIPVSICTTRVWGAPPPTVFRGPWMSGVNRTSMDALTMEVALPTPPRHETSAVSHSAFSASALVPCEGLGDDTDMMDTASPGLALLGGAFGVSPNPIARFGSAFQTSCGSGVGSPMVFYSPRLGVFN